MNPTDTTDTTTTTDTMTAVVERDEHVPDPRVKRLRDSLDELERGGRLAGSRLDVLAHVLGAFDKEADAVAFQEASRALEPLRSTPITPLVFASEVLASLPDEWKASKPATPTGLWQLDRLLTGGLRAGDMLAFAGAAKSGKSALAGQIAFDAARVGAVVLYASVEMPPREVVSRWLALQCFRLAEGDRWVSYGSIRHGRAWRGEVARSEFRNGAINRLLIDAIESAREVLARIVIQHVSPGTTPADLRSLFARAREKYPDAPALLIVDPLQRFFAGPSGVLTAGSRALDSINANETERIGMVAQQIKEIADRDALSVIFTSDTTKEAVRTAGGSSTSLRGSYQLNHLATAIFGLYAERKLEAFAKFAEPLGFKSNELELAIRDRLPPWFETRPDLDKLGRRFAVVECSGNRNGDSSPMFLGYVPGAMAFVEADAPKSDEYDDEYDPTDSNPRAAAPRRER